jgi:P-type Ca2+ transporter type 2C
MTNAQGLSEQEAAIRLAQDGPNTLAKPQRRRPFRLILDVMREPMLALLLAGGVIYLILGNRNEALVLLAFACLSIGITIAQEARSERVLAALRDLTNPQAQVIRAGVRRKMDAAGLVCGDIIAISEGDRVPADARLIGQGMITVDESLLTGEAVPRAKSCGTSGADQIFAGTLIVAGDGLARVTATGPRSQIGQIGTSLSLLQSETPHLQSQLQRLVFWFALVGGAVSVAVILLFGLLRGGDWLAAFLAGISVSMAMLPEEFPMVLTVFMAMGAWRISSVKVLTRRAAAIESLGAASVLCTDKTGTLTLNQMTVASISPVGEAASGPEAAQTAGAAQDLAAAATRACAIAPFDPMEKAFHTLSPLGAGVLIRSYPLTSSLLAMTQVWEQDGKMTAYSKGAPEAIAALCGLSVDSASIAGLAEQGQRVLAVATAPANGSLPDSQTGFQFQYLGLIGLVDPLRDTVPDAVARCLAAGIRVIMITGDHPVTALAIGLAAGLTADAAITGAQLTSMDDATLQEVLRRSVIFARITPSQKLRIVQALKSTGAIVAMTGDGVNDAPSLKAAQIGIAMGKRGTDVAREAADIVLLEDDFAAIVTTIALGRRIYGNLRKAMSFILAVHVPIAGLALLPLILGLPLLFGPIHIAFIEMIIDPVCALVFEAEEDEAGLMTRPPRPITEPLFSTPTILWSVAQGIIALAGVTGLYLAAQGLAPDQIRALVFSALVLVIFALILVNRRRSASVLRAVTKHNQALWMIAVGIAAVLGIVLSQAALRDLFGFALSDPIWWAGPPLMALLVMLALESIKAVAAKARKRPV